MQFPHVVTIERATAGSRDDYGHPTQTWTAQTGVQAWVQPKSARDLALLSQGGPVVSDYTIFTHATDISESDRIVFGAQTYQIDGVRDAAGIGHHLEIDAHKVTT